VLDENSGDVWVATDAGVSLMSPVNGPGVDPENGTTFQNFDADDGLADNDVQGIAIAPSGDVYFACDGGLTRGTPSGNSYSFTTWTTAEGLPDNNVRGVAVDVIPIQSTMREIVWAATPNGLARLDPVVDQISVITQNDGLASDDCRSVTVGANHVKYVGTNNPNALSIYRGW
jgi:ligand-binding sensor domain-containing protein